MQAADKAWPAISFLTADIRAHLRPRPASPRGQDVREQAEGSEPSLCVLPPRCWALRPPAQKETCLAGHLPVSVIPDTAEELSDKTGPCPAQRHPRGWVSPTGGGESGQWFTLGCDKGIKALRTEVCASEARPAGSCVWRSALHTAWRLAISNEDQVPTENPDSINTEMMKGGCWALGRTAWNHP